MGRYMLDLFFRAINSSHQHNMCFFRSHQIEATVLGTISGEKSCASDHKTRLNIGQPLCLAQPCVEVVERTVNDSVRQ